MRQIVFDTETTGFDPSSGDRLVEIGAVELRNNLPTGEIFHVYVNPERSVPQDAVNVHGLDDAFLRDKPKFKAVADAFLEFIGNADLIAHNADFDRKFITAELEWVKKTPPAIDRYIDTLKMARKKFPGAQNSLDALCRRFGVDNSTREKHGALLDSELLAEVYLELIGGRQPDFDLASESKARGVTGAGRAKGRPTPLPIRLLQDEIAAHRAFVDEMKEPLWAKKNPDSFGGEKH